MDHERFDRLARRWATRLPRRGMLGTALVAGIGGVIGIGSAGVEAAPRRCASIGARCRQGTDCCSRGCCGGVCVSLYYDEQNCGACGHTCANDEMCFANACCTLANAACSANPECCEGGCVDGRCCIPAGQTIVFRDARDQRRCCSGKWRNAYCTSDGECFAQCT